MPKSLMVKFKDFSLHHREIANESEDKRKVQKMGEGKIDRHDPSSKSVLNRI